MVKIKENEVAFKLKSGRKVSKFALPGTAKVAFEGDKMFVRDFGMLLFELNLNETEWVLFGDAIKIR